MGQFGHQFFFFFYFYGFEVLFPQYYVKSFLMNVFQISVVLEEQKENQIISVLEVHQIQTKFVEKPYDSTVSFSIYRYLVDERFFADLKCYVLF